MPVTVPTSLDAALTAISADPDATLLAGGTDLMVESTTGSASSATSLRSLAYLSWEP